MTKNKNGDRDRNKGRKSGGNRRGDGIPSKKMHSS